MDAKTKTPLSEASTPLSKNLYRVVRPFEADGGKLKPGTVVDTANWKWTQNLVRSRYLEKVED